MGKLIQQGLTAYSWAGVGVLILFLGRIAYFYGKTSHQRVRYWMLAVPSLLLGAGVAWYSIHEIGFTGQPTGDLLLFGGGMLLIALGSRLRDLMSGAR
jgi:hypothetical protein